MPNLTTVTLTSGLGTGGTGTVSTLDNIIGTAGTGSTNVLTVQGSATGTAIPATSKVTDGTNTAAVKAASTAPVVGDPALVVSISPNSVNANGLTAASGSAPVVQAPTTTEVSVTPTVTAGAYTAGNVIGGILTFASLLDSVRFAGILESITVKFKGTTVTGNITVNLFKASPSNGTYADHAAATWNALDAANLLGSYVLTTPVSNLGTMTVYNSDGIGKAIQGTTASLFAVVTVAGTPTPASTTDMTVSLGVLPG